MRWDPVLTGAVARELSRALSGARLAGVFMDRGAGTLHVYFRETTLLVGLTPSWTGFQMRGAAGPPEGTRTFPCKLRVVESLPDERVLVLVLPRLRGRGGTVRIVLELAPNRANGAVVEGEDWTVRHVLHARTGDRAPTVGRPYPRPHSDRRGVETPLTLEDWLGLLEAEAPEERAGRLLRHVAFTSRVNVAALVGPPEGRAGEEVAVDLESGYRLWLRLRDAATIAEVSDPPGRESVLLSCPWGRQPYPVCLPGYTCRPSPSLVEAMDEASAEQGPGPGLVPSRLTGALERALSVADKKVRKLTRELERAPDPGPVRATGDLILAHMHQVRRGASAVTLPGFAGDEVTVELDPALAPQENAARYYDRARRAERARERLPGLIREAETHAAELEDLLVRIRAGEATSEDIRALLPEEQIRARTDSGAQAPSLPYRTYRTSGGLEVRVGRGRRHNDDLTFRHSRGNDIWLHARHTAGAHVILRWEGEGGPPARDLEEAAGLAALHSKARTSGSVPVDWTRRKHVRKPRKAPPGRVLADRVKTVFVEPDPSLPDRLKRS